MISLDGDVLRSPPDDWYTQMATVSPSWNRRLTAAAGVKESPAAGTLHPRYRMFCQDDVPAPITR